MDYAVFDTSLDSVFIIDKDRRLLYVNEAAALMCGYRQRRMKAGTPLSDFVVFEDPELFCNAGGIEGSESASAYREIRFKSQAGKEGVVQLTLQPDPENRAAAWILFGKDVSLEESLHMKFRAELQGKEQVIIELQKAQAALEDYSKNLEVMVEQRTAEVRAANRVLNAMVNCLGQGFVVFGPDGICHPTVSKAAETLFEVNPANKLAAEVLGCKGNTIEEFQNWSSALFLEPLPFEDLARFGPPEFVGTQSRHIKLNYYPMRDEENKVVGVVVVATDKTDEIVAQQAFERERAYANMIVKLSKNRRAKADKRRFRVLAGVPSGRPGPESLHQA